MGRPAYQDSWRAEEELAVPEFLIKAANCQDFADLDVFVPDI